MKKLLVAITAVVLGIAGTTQQVSAHGTHDADAIWIEVIMTNLGSNETGLFPIDHPTTPAANATGTANARLLNNRLQLMSVEEDLGFEDEGFENPRTTHVLSDSEKEGVLSQLKLIKEAIKFYSKPFALADFRNRLRTQYKHRLLMKPTPNLPKNPANIFNGIYLQAKEPFDLKRQILIDKYLDSSIKFLEKYEDKNPDTDLSETKEEANNLKEHLTELSKNQVVKRLSKFWALCRKKRTADFKEGIF